MLDDESKTDFIVADLVAIEMDAYYSESGKNKNLINLDDESVENAIANGNLKINENSNNHIEYKYSVSESNKVDIREINDIFRTDKLAILTLSNDSLVVNLDDWNTVDSITTVLREGVDVADLLKKEEVASKTKKKKPEESKVNVVSKVPGTEIDRRILALFKKLYQEDNVDQISVRTNNKELESISGSVGILSASFVDEIHADITISQNGDIIFSNETGGAMGISESKSGNIFADLSEDEWKNIRENVSISKVEEVASKFFGNWTNGFNDPNRGINFKWSDLSYIETLSYAFEANPDINIDSIDVVDDNQITLNVSLMEYKFELELIDDNTINFLLLGVDINGDRYEELKTVLTKE